MGRAFAKGETNAERSIVFLNVTAEEKGLLGTEYYASSPLYPLGKTVTVLNMNALDPHGPAHDFSTSGSAKQDLLDELVATAKRFTLRFTPDSSPEAGYFFPSAPFPFAQRGVPTLYFETGKDWVAGGLAAGSG